MNRLILCLLFATLAAPLSAQLEPPNEAGVTMGHVHLNVSDPDLYRQLWIDHFGAVPLAKEGLNGVKLPGMIVLFRKQVPTGDAIGTALDHFGLKVRNRDELLEKWKAAGQEVGRVFTGSEGFPNAYVLGPDGFRMELQQDVDLPAIAVTQHLHYRTAKHLELQQWYQDNFGAVFSHRGSHDGVDLPGINFSLDPLRRPRDADLPTKGRLIDHIGFEVNNLEAFCKQLEAKGVVFDQPYRKIERLNLGLAFLTDPSGVYVELTEGLDQF
ncbi:MAG: VOC family protein [Acidobacteria bacterium]|nr:VOC family protein [Acidobacteriota bacterium]MDA1234173.1 VOC family protein [Acidobacteriota bacterium]